MKQTVVLALILIITGSLVFNTGCRKDEPAPTMPPSSSMVMNFSDYDTTSTRTVSNWLHGAVHVGVWNIVITIGLAVPVASYYVALNQEAEYDHQNEKWIWDYNFNSFGLHHAELTAHMESDTVVWEMKIDNFLWYYGHSHSNGSGGYWLMNESASQPTPLLRIDWQINGSGTTYLRYTNVAPSTSTAHYKNRGEYIYYGTVSTGEFTRFYDIFMKDDVTPTISNLVEIEWSFQDKHGRVKDPAFYSDSLWHCWDTSLNDVTCP